MAVGTSIQHSGTEGCFCRPGTFRDRKPRLNIPNLRLERWSPPDDGEVVVSATQASALSLEPLHSVTLSKKRFRWPSEGGRFGLQRTDFAPESFLFS